MTECKIASTKMSSFGLTARVVLEEKGVAYERIEIDPSDLKSPGHIAGVHPFGKVPALYHEGIHLYETAAIARYVDEAFEGPSLQPTNAVDRARMQMWINIASHYIYPTMIVDLVVQRLAPKIGVFGGVTDEDVVAAAVPSAAHQLDLIAAALAEQGAFLAGSFSLADIFVASIVQYVAMTPEGAALLGERPTVAEWVARITSRPSYAKAAYDLGL